MNKNKNPTTVKMYFTPTNLKTWLWVWGHDEIDCKIRSSKAQCGFGERTEKDLMVLTKKAATEPFSQQNSLHLRISGTPP